MSFKYFDLHIHPVFKTLFKNAGNQVSGWEYIKVPDGIMGNCFDSQACLRMIFCKGNINLLCVGKHAPEKGMVYNLATRLAAGLPGYDNFMEISRLRKLHRSQIDYQQVHCEEIYHLLREPIPPDQRNFTIKPLIQNMREYDPTDFNTMHLVFNVEGAHMFYEKGNRDDRIDEMLRIFNEYRQAHLLLYVTIAHLTPNVFSNHADGNKIFPNEKTWPSKRGISLFGERLVKEIYDKHVLIDLKHMSWVAREDLYKLRIKNGWDGIPLIASHAALTGFKVKDRMDYIFKTKGIKRARKVYKVRYKKKKGIIDKTMFNPNSINLYDEDVVQILKSKGLLGINIDKRILGASQGLDGRIKMKEVEFISVEETADWFAMMPSFSPIYDDYLSNLRGGKFVPDEEDKQESEEEFNELFPRPQKKKKKARQVVKDPKIELHLKFYCNQLLKLRQIADEYAAELPGINMWDHICMGADFDGLISTIHCCRDVTRVEEFAKMVENNLQDFADTAGINLGMGVPDIIERIFFKNGYDFLVKHFGI